MPDYKEVLIERLDKYFVNQDTEFLGSINNDITLLTYRT